MTAKTENNAFEDALQMGVLKMLLADKLITSTEFKLISESLKNS